MDRSMDGKGADRNENREKLEELKNRIEVLEIVIAGDNLGK